MAKFREPLPIPSPRSDRDLIHRPPGPQSRTTHQVTVSELSHRLQEAIQSGDEDLAAQTAAEMARQRAHVCVQSTTKQSQSSKHTYRVKVHIEDVEERAGHVILSVDPMMSIELIKNKMFQCFGFPLEVQRWIVGSSLAKDSDLLCDLVELSNGTSLFLYLSSAHATGLNQMNTQDDGFDQIAQNGNDINAQSGHTVTASPLPRSPRHQSDYQTHIPVPNDPAHRSPGRHNFPSPEGANTRQGFWLSPKEQAKWTCNRCTFAGNKLSNQRCELCDAEKPNVFTFSH